MRGGICLCHPFIEPTDTNCFFYALSPGTSQLHHGKRAGEGKCQDEPLLARKLNTEDSPFSNPVERGWGRGLGIARHIVSLNMIAVLLRLLLWPSHSCSF